MSEQEWKCPVCGGTKYKKAEAYVDMRNPHNTGELNVVKTILLGYECEKCSIMFGNYEKFGEVEIEMGLESALKG